MAKTSIPPSAHKFCTSHRHLLGIAHRFKWRLANIMICVQKRLRGKSNSNFENKNFIMTRRVQSATAALIVTSYYYNITIGHNIEPRVYKIIGSQSIPAIIYYRHRLPFGNSIFSYSSGPILIL